MYWERDGYNPEEAFAKAVAYAFLQTEPREMVGLCNSTRAVIDYLEANPPQVLIAPERSITPILHVIYDQSPLLSEMTIPLTIPVGTRQLTSSTHRFFEASMPNAWMSEIVGSQLAAVTNMDELQRVTLLDEAVTGSRVLSIAASIQNVLPATTHLEVLTMQESRQEIRRALKPGYMREMAVGGVHVFPAPLLFTDNDILLNRLLQDDSVRVREDHEGIPSPHIHMNTVAIGMFINTFRLYSACLEDDTETVQELKSKLSTQWRRFSPKANQSGRLSYWLNEFAGVI